MQPNPPVQSEGGMLHGDMAFRYRIVRPERDSGATLILLHGSGPDETSMVGLGREIAPESTLLAIRGRIVQDGNIRWFSRVTPTRFDQESIRTEAAAFAAFVPAVARVHRIDLARTAFLGYSNGANLVSSVMFLNPGVVSRAALLRAMPVLDDVPPTDLTGAQVLVVAGAGDATYGGYAPALAELLAAHGAQVESHQVPAGHEFGSADARTVANWLRRRTGAADA